MKTLGLSLLTVIAIIVGFMAQAAVIAVIVIPFIILWVVLKFVTWRTPV